MNYEHKADGYPALDPEGFDRKAGAAFFGIDKEYLSKVQMKEIFELVGHGFSYESLSNMSIEKRRYFYMMLVKKYEDQNKE